MDKIIIDRRYNTTLMDLMPVGETEQDWCNFISWLWSGAR